MPQLRPIYSEWEDHWWPKALPPSRRISAGAANAAVRARAERPYVAGDSDGAGAARRRDEARP
jgi:hypothetical protein